MPPPPRPASPARDIARCRAEAARRSLRRRSEASPALPRRDDLNLVLRAERRQMPPCRRDEGAVERGRHFCVRKAEIGAKLGEVARARGNWLTVEDDLQRTPPSRSR